VANINFHNVSKEEEALRMAYNDLIAFGKLFLPDDFLRSETPWFHYDVADSINDQNIKQLAIIMPRGHGKTVLTKADLMRSFCFNQKDFEWGFVDKKPDPLFYGWVSATAKLATGNMDYIKSHIEINEKIQYYFGDLRGKKWTEVDIEMANGCKLISKSNISGIRGGAKLHKRYDLIVLDDFEDENNTITPEARNKNSNLITAVVFPALEPHTGRLRINGTPVHFDSFINNLIVNYQKAEKKNKKFSWNVKMFQAEQSDGTALWGSWFGKKELERKKKFYADSGQPHKYYQEYMMQVQSEEDSMWTRSHIKEYEATYMYEPEAGIGFLTFPNGDVKPVNVFAGVDPATDSTRRDADFSVILFVAVDELNNIYILDYTRKRSLPVLGIPGEDKKGIVDYMFDMQHIYHSNLMVIEDTSMSKPVIQSVMSEMKRRNDFSIKFKAEKPGTRMSKRDRIQEVLAARFSVGQIYLKPEHYDLYQEILTFGPRMSHDDTIDALAYACKYSFPVKGVTENKGSYSKKKPKAKSWVVA
tara:strand:+ start:11552 stop:13141 length:1590 start_codon:yes stop_codon:yes gene_type:complete